MAKAMNFCGKVYQVRKNFPKEELYGITSQWKRGAISNPLNIAEGSSCKTKREFIQFSYIALRSQYEVVTIIKLASRLGYIDNSSEKEREERIAEIGRLLLAVINSLHGKSKNQQPKTKN